MINQKDGMALKESITPCELVFEQFENQKGILKIGENCLLNDVNSSENFDSFSDESDSQTQAIQPRFSSQIKVKKQKVVFNDRKNNSEVLTKKSEVSIKKTPQMQSLAQNRSFDHENISSLIRLIFNFIIVKL